jgi:hypothetical protein
MEVNKTEGIIYFRLYKANGEPKKLKHLTMKAVVNDMKTIRFKADVIQFTRKRRHCPLSNTYIYQGDWIKTIDKFDIVFYVRYWGALHKMEFDYKRK